ncbi:helix-turn-helix domain-containing protein [Candidatus Albibeggiatoa sp. nov. BB20]|uniref:ArsR/SmtB family transcription factor n=1 Tax=Candidatus Albibeggiatoa sp. nov. BB20 TaxID=3162723 RepID=UPI00336553D2
MSNIKSLENDLPLIDEYAKIFKALSNPIRLRVFLYTLAKHPPGTVIDIDVDAMMSCQRSLAEECGVAASTMSHHIKELNNAGLLHTKRTGQQVVIWVDVDAMEKLKLFFSTISE